MFISRQNVGQRGVVNAFPSITCIYLIFDLLVFGSGQPRPPSNVEWEQNSVTDTQWSSRRVQNNTRSALAAFRHPCAESSKLIILKTLRGCTNYVWVSHQVLCRCVFYMSIREPQNIARSRKWFRSSVKTVMQPPVCVYLISWTTLLFYVDWRNTGTRGPTWRAEKWCCWEWRKTLGHSCNRSCRVLHSTFHSKLGWQVS